MTDDPRVGTTLADRYRLDDLLGTGGMGRVYAAEHILMRKKLAVKVLHRELTTVPEVVKRFEREAMAAAHIEHPNVAAATDFGKLPDGSVFLVLEFVQGELLRDEIAKGPLPPDRALRIARQIASALASAHELEIVHRDLKPENVMLVKKGNNNDFVKVLDFGIAKVPIGEVGELARDGQPITRAGMVFGTPEYMAPEQALGQSVDGRADLYALGTMLFEMLAGVRPYSSKSQVGILGQQLANPVPSFAVRAPGIGIPLSVEQVVHRLLARDADDRYQSANEVVTAIDELLRLTAPPDTRLFTQLGGSPREMLGSYPGLDTEVKSGPIPLPSFADESDSGLVPRPELVAGDATPAAVRPGFDNGLDPIGPSGALPTPLARTSSAKGVELLRRLNRAPLLKGAVQFVEARRSSLPPPIGQAFKGVPGLAILGGVGLALIGLLAVLVAGLVSSLGEDHPQAQPDASARVETKAADSAAPVAPLDTGPPSLADQLKQAESQGLPALEALAKANPNDGSVQLALAQGRVNAKQYAEAVGAVSAALKVDPELNVSKRVASLLFTTAQSKSGRERTFQLLEGPMGSRGADIVYDIAVHPTIKPQVKARAEKYLKSEAFERSSSPELNIAVALRHAERCEQKHALLLRAKNVGDSRSLASLEPLVKTDGCGDGGKRDCYPCLRADSRLADAIAAVKARAPHK
ncbi:MAG TPA: protein kinase [Polyangiaceae bacterium]|nr:protein kinase [Polyangiaceae bacterium]